MSEEGTVTFGLSLTAFKVTEDMEIQTFLVAINTSASSREREIWELITIKTAAETLRPDDTESQIREPMTEH